MNKGSHLLSSIQFHFDELNSAGNLILTELQNILFMQTYFQSLAGKMAFLPVLCFYVSKKRN